VGLSVYLNEEVNLTREEIEKLISQIKKTLEDFDQIGKTSEYIKELSNLAFLQLEAGYYKDSEINLGICLNHFKNQHDRLGQASVYAIFGILYFKNSHYQKSIENYNFALDIYKELNQIAEEIECLKGIGMNLIKLNNFDDACEIFLECSAVCSDNNDFYNLLDCLGNLIYIYETVGKWDVVYDLYKKSLDAFKKLRDNKGIITSYFNLGILQKKNQDYEDAIRYFKLGTNLAIDTNYVELILKGLSYVGEILVYQGNLKEAKEQYIKALSFAKRVNAKNSILQLRILLKSLGLSDLQIEEEIKKSES
jgi:tetratricopeptide (TPR) repeat protein